MTMDQTSPYTKTPEISLFRTRDANQEERLDDLTARIESRIRDLREQGEFADVRALHAAVALERRQRLQAKVDDAIRRGDLLAIIWTEANRDFQSIFAGLEDAIGRLDARTERAA